MGVRLTVAPPSFSTSLSVPLGVCDFVGVDDEGLAVVLGHDVQDDAGDDEQEPCDDQHHRADQRGEVGDHAGLGEFEGNCAAQHNADDANDQAQPSEEGKGLVFADHAEDGAHDLDAVTYGVQLGH